MAGGSEGGEGGEEAPAAERQVAGTNQLAMTHKVLQAPTASLYQTQQKVAAPTRAGQAHVAYATGYAAGLGTCMRVHEGIVCM